MHSQHSPLTTTLISLVTLGASEAFAASELPQSPDSIYFTLSEQTDAKGPVYSPEAGASDAFKYVDDLTTLILTEADRMASFWLDEGNTDAYVSFLMGALAVPLHESGLQHFRKLDHEHGRCAEGMNSGSVLRKAAERALALIVPDCWKFKASEPALQLVGSGDALSTGLMQINFVAHADYLPSGDFLDVTKTIRTGLEQYLHGFKALVERPSDFTCVQGPRDGEINYENVIRGAWAGAYNSGNIGESCRFTAATNAKASARDQKWARENDVPFAKNLKEVLDAKKGFYAEHLSDAGSGAYRKIASDFSSFGGGGLSGDQLRMDAAAIHSEIAGLPPSSSPKSNPVARAVVKIVPTMRVNVRSRPSTVAPIKSTLKNGTAILVYDRFRNSTERKGWVAITPTKDRWISSSFLRKAQ